MLASRGGLLFLLLLATEKSPRPSGTIIAQPSRAISFPRTPPGAPSARQMFLSAVVQAVKKGPNARGGLVWKTHAFWKVSKTRKANARKKLRALNDVQSVLAHAAELQKAALGAAPK